MSNEILVKFRPEGHKELINAIKRLGAAQNTLNRSMKKLNITTDEASRKSSILGTRNKRLTDENNKLANSFATIRSKMLLVSFAMSLGVRQITRMTKETATLGAMSTAFETLSGGSENATIAIDKLREATNNTMSNFDLFQQANNAMVLGITKNSDEMAEMFDIAQRLGKALGQDTRLSVESLITGIGRQSRMMLDNIGIVVDTDKAYKIYAKTLKKSADDLTDVERKQAFLNATMESARAKVDTLNDETSDVQTSFQEFSAAAINLQARLGEVFTAFEPLVIAMTSFMDAIDNEKIERFVDTLKTLGVILAGIVATGVIAFLGVMVYWFGVAGTAAMAFRGIITKLGSTFKFWFVPVLTGAIFHIKGFKKEVETTSPTIETFTGFVGESADETERLNAAFATGATTSNELGESFETLTNAVLATRLENELLNTVYKKTKQSQLDANKAQIENVEFVMREKEVTAELIGMLDYLIQQREKLVALPEQEITARQQLLGVLDEQQQKELEVFQASLQIGQEILNQVNGITSAMSNSINIRMNNELKALRATQAFRNADFTTRRNMEEDVTNSYIKERQKVAKYEKASAIFGSLINTALAVTKVAPSIPLMALIASLGAVQTGLIMATPLPKFQQGGMVGGRRHSQGGTMIEAERGEFVMSRNAVDAIGVENLNRMNRGGSGAITVNVTGNVMSENYTEDVVIPHIKEALRRGEDIGIG